jgi:hypothetical protein
MFYAARSMLGCLVRLAYKALTGREVPPIAPRRAQPLAGPARAPRVGFQGGVYLFRGS